MMTRRSRGREVALQVLYQVEQNAGVSAEEICQFIRRRLLEDRKLCDFTEGLITGVKEHQPRIDAMISDVAENWRLDRMAAIDRNILRLGAYEMLFCPEVPGKVAINEALELAKRYSTAQSSRFVNGVLDRVLQWQVEELRLKTDRETDQELRCEAELELRPLKPPPNEAKHK
jgi:N utilization substance protein B